MGDTVTYPYFKVGLDSGTDSVLAENIPTLDRSTLERSEAYRPHPDLSHAVNVALILGMPLLVTGEPGTGKTQLAFVIAHALKCKIYKFETKSTSIARDLFYTFDALGSFKAKKITDQKRFIHYQALGRSILDAFPADELRVSRLLPSSGTSDYIHSGPRRSVVLIDEIDKAPRDFPNDVLNEIERLYFRVPELNNLGTPGADGETGVEPQYRPIVVISSNSEKGLPDPFLRRCVYFDIPFPTEEQMRDIVAARMEKLRGGSVLLADALDLFYRLRHRHPQNPKGETNLKKEPSTAELLNWIQILLHRNAHPNQTLKIQKDLIKETLATLVKNADDQPDALSVIEGW
jgi:MoxR-like ATPase